MPFCGKCGTQCQEGTNFCPSCGTPTAQPQQPPRPRPQPVQQPQAGYTSRFQAMNNTADSSAEFDAQDVQNNKAMAILAYLGLLVFIPMFVSKDSPFVKYHVNQGLVLCIAGVAYGILSLLLNSIILAISWRLYFLTVIIGLFSLVFVGLAILGIVRAANGQAKDLPVIGNIRLIK